MTIAVGIGRVSCSATSTLFGLNKDRAQPNDPLLAIDGVPLQRYCQFLLVVFEVKLDLIAPHLVHLACPGPGFGRKKAEMKVPRLLIFHEVDDVDHWLSSPNRREFFDSVRPDTIVLVEEA